MLNWANTGRAFYAIGIAGLGIQQFIYSDLRPVIWPPGWPEWLHRFGILGYLVGAAFIAAAAMMILGRKVRLVCVLLGGVLLLLFVAVQCPYVLFVQPYQSSHLGLWTDPLKELALAGGAFAIAGLHEDESSEPDKNWFLQASAKLIPYARIMFSITMVAFGIDHFFYTDFVAGLVPSWFADHTFWTYFAGTALISSGVAIILEIKLERIAFLLSLMLFLWFIVLHIPRAVATPTVNEGNEITSVFEALAFSGIALCIAWAAHRSAHTQSRAL